jgi:hypothetical protein
MGTPSKASPPPIIVTSNFKGGYASTDTISKENILHEQTNLPTIFEKKQLALNYLKKHKNLYLFSEDLNEKGVKRFIVTTYEKIYEVSKKKIFHLYENIEDRQLVKLHLDIDVKENKMCKMINRDNYLDQLIVVATSLVNNELELYGIDDPKYTVQTANREDKLSAHIIYPKVHFKTIHHMKHFMIKLKSPLIDKKILDLAIYRVGCFRLLFNSKYGKNNILIPHEKTRNNKKLFMDSLITNILPKSTLVKIKLPSNKIVCKSKTKKSSLKNHTSKEDVPLKKLEKLVSLLNKERVDDYKIWIDVGMSLYNCNSDSFNIWRKWSKQSSKFDRNTCIYKWNTFAKSNKTIGTLKYLAKQDSPDEYGDMDCTLEKVKYDTIKFNRPYLLEMTKDKKIKTVKNLIGCEKIYMEKIKDRKSVVTKTIDNWMKKGKVLCIESPYDSGKTTVGKQIIKEYKPKKILFISYRQTLSYDVHGKFKEFGITNYMYNIFDNKRVVCQIESLEKLIVELEYGKFGFHSYDLVVFDEIEGILSHFKSKTIKNKENSFRMIKDIIDKAKKVLFMDGDFGDRAYSFAEGYDPVILENTVKKDQKEFCFVRNKEKIDVEIENDLEQGKNIVLASMSQDIANQYYEKYKDKYKSIIHCSLSDDQNKIKLYNVNKEWSKYQLVIYSPSVESGVDFNTEHFDKIYGFLCNNSCTPRGFMQMCFRVRKPKCNIIKIYTNNVFIKEHANFFTYEDMYDFVDDIYVNYLTQRDDMELYKKIIAHNECENMNSIHNFFPSLLQLIKKKGHVYKVYEEEDNKKIKNKVLTKNRINELLEADDINDMEYTQLLLKQKLSKTTRLDKTKIEKHSYKKIWKVDKVDKDFLDKFYGKNNMIHNLRFLVNENNEVDNEFLNYDKAKKIKKKKIVKSLINDIGFDDIYDKKTIYRDDFIAKIDNIKNNNELFKNPKKNQTLFGFYKGKLNNIDTPKQFLGLVNGIFKNYGFCLKKYQKRIQLDNVKQFNMVYKLKNNKQIDKYI